MTAPRFDSWLIARVFQPVVDLTGHPPEWLARQSAILAGLAALVRFGMFGGRDAVDWFGIACCLLGVAFMVGLTCSSLFQAAIGSLWWLRAINVAVCVLDLILLATVLLWPDLRSAVLRNNLSTEPRMLLSALGDLSMTAVLYFAACSPPRPRAPRRRLVTAGGAA